MYNTCTLFFIAGVADCEDKIPDTVRVTCNKNPLTRQPLSCNDIPMASKLVGIPIPTLCKRSISAHPISCDGDGNVEDYCRKTCLNCGINLLY